MLGGNIIISYKTKNEILNDFGYVLDNKTNMPERLFQRMVDCLIWNWTGVFGKTTGCRYWSKNAYQQLISRACSVKELNLRHDHAVPRKILIDWFSKIETTPSEQDLAIFFEEYVFGVVALQSDHKKLHEVDAKCDWAFLTEQPSVEKALVRYKFASIDVLEIDWTGGPRIIKNFEL